MSLLSSLLDWLASFFGEDSFETPAMRSYTTQYIRNLTYANPPAQIRPELAFTLFALEVGIKDFAWIPGETFNKTRSLSNRHVGSGKGFWSGQKITVNGQKGPETLRIYDSPEQSLQDFDQLMKDPLYAEAAKRGAKNDRRGFFEGVSNAGFATTDYHIRLENRFQSLKQRGII